MGAEVSIGVRPIKYIASASRTQSRRGLLPGTPLPPPPSDRISPSQFTHTPCPTSLVSVTAHTHYTTVHHEHTTRRGHWYTRARPDKYSFTGLTKLQLGSRCSNCMHAIAASGAKLQLRKPCKAVLIRARACVPVSPACRMFVMHSGIMGVSGD